MKSGSNIDRKYKLMFCFSWILEEGNELNTTSLKSYAPYSNINYSYRDENVKEGDGDKEYDPNECFDSDDSNLGW